MATLSSRIANANHWMVKAEDVLNEAKVLASSGATRLGAYNRLYYAAHHAARAMAEMAGQSPRRHPSVAKALEREWVRRRRLPSKYHKLLKDLYKDRDMADYGEYIESGSKKVKSLLREVEMFVHVARRNINTLHIADILKLLSEEHKEIKDFSFDVYCPKSYYHHTRFTIWIPKKRITKRFLKNLQEECRNLLKQLGVKEWKDYVVGLNSKVNQYAEQHLLLLEFDDLSTFPKLGKGVNGYIFRTEGGYHFIGSSLLKSRIDWRITMRGYKKVASSAHIDLSLKRGYATLRITTSDRKRYLPKFAGKIRKK